VEGDAGRGLAQALDDDAVSHDLDGLDHVVRLGDELGPCGRLRASRIRRHQPEAGRAAVGEEVEPVVAQHHAVQGVFALHHRREARRAPEVAQVDVGARPTLGDAHGQEAAVRGEVHRGPVLGLPRLEDQGVLAPVPEEDVPVHAAVVVLLSGGDRCRVGVAGVEDPEPSRRHSREQARVWGIASGRSRPLSTSLTRRTLFSLPPSERP
jgi:hypothetical protein